MSDDYKGYGVIGVPANIEMRRHTPKAEAALSAPPDWRQMWDEHAASVAERIMFADGMTREARAEHIKLLVREAMGWTVAS